MTDTPTTATETLEYYITKVSDIACFEIALLTKVLKEEKGSLRMMEAIENARKGYMEIKRDGALILEMREKELDNRYYNIRDFLLKTCSAANSYLSGVFNVDIEYRLIEEDNVNIVFDGRLVEKAVYDGIYGLLCEAGMNNSRVTVYAKDLSKFVKICIRCEGATAKENAVYDNNSSFSSYIYSGMGSYAELAMKKLGGDYRSVYGKNDVKVELCIPKKLKTGQLCMKEENMEMRNGEMVSEFIPCDKFEIERIFVGLKAR